MRETRHSAFGPDEFDSWVQEGPRREKIFGSVLDMAALIDRFEIPEQQVKPQNKKKAEEIVEEGYSKAWKAITKYTRLAVAAGMLTGAWAYVSEKPDGKFSDKDRAKLEMQQDGITDEQRSTYKPGLSELLYRGIKPVTYQELSPLMRPTWKDAKDFVVNNFAPTLIEGWKLETGLEARSDAWSMYLGMPQEHNSFGISDYKPNNSKEDKFYYKLNYFIDNLKEEAKSRAKGTDEGMKVIYKELLAEVGGNESAVMRHAEEVYSEDTIIELTDWLKRGKGAKPMFYGQFILRKVEIIKSNNGKWQDVDRSGGLGVMGNYTLSLDQDEKGSYIAYYDIWDLDVATEKTKFRMGRPLEIYDRIYYNPQTGEILDDKADSETKKTLAKNVERFQASANSLSA